MLQCVAVCHSVSQCVVLQCATIAHPTIAHVCCSVLQCVAVCCSVLCCSVSLLHIRQSHNWKICDYCTSVQHSVLQRAAVCCRVLQSVAVCCSLLQCVAVCCSVLQCAAMCCSMLQCVAVCCSVLQCAAVCRSVLQCVAVCCSVLQCVAVCCSVLQCVAVSYRTSDYRTIEQPKRSEATVCCDPLLPPWCARRCAKIVLCFGPLATCEQTCVHLHVSLTHLCVSHDSFICGTWIIHMCDKHLFMCVTWLIHMCDMTYSYHDDAGADEMGVSIRSRMRSHSRRGIDFLTAACWNVCDMTHSHVWHDAFTCVTWRFHMCDMTHSYVRHDWIIRVTWLLHMHDMTVLHE